LILNHGSWIPASPSRLPSNLDDHLAISPFRSTNPTSSHEPKSHWTEDENDGKKNEEDRNDGVHWWFHTKNPASASKWEEDPQNWMSAGMEDMKVEKNESLTCWTW